MKVYVRSDVGRVRPVNEDSFCQPKEGERFCAVADGMGGHNAGEVASSMAVETFANAMRSGAPVNALTLRRAVEAANQAVYQASLREAKYSGMGTTFTALSQSGRDVHIAHVGDSRAYLLRHGSIMRLTIDHTLVEEMVMQGLITPSEAKHHPKRNYITRALGTADWVEVDLIQIERMSGDVFFLCSDGLSNHVEEKRILELAQRPGSWEEKASALVDIAMENGSTDNITAMFVVFEEEKRQ